MLDAYEKICKMKLQLLNSEFKNHPWVEGWKNAGYELNFFDDPSQLLPNEIVVCGSDLLHGYVGQFLNSSRPAIYIGRGYVGNHTTKTRRLWRASVNGWANTILKPIPYKRWHLMEIPKHPWKVKKISRVLIAPSKMTTAVWSKQSPNEWAEEIAEKFSNVEIKIRHKEKKAGSRWATLWGDLDWADLVVSQSSAITCEAFWYGKKVLSTEPCPTWAADRTTFKNWQDPSEPKLRNIWHEHLAWNQFNISEWINGSAFKLIEKYLGSIKGYKSGHTYNFTETP